MGKQCILCKHKKFQIISKKVRDSSKHKVIQCKNCKHFQLTPIPSQKEDEIFYDKNLQEKNIKYFGGINEHRNKSKEDTIRRVNFLKKFIKKKDKILEIGSGHGFFLESMTDLGYNITGIEISKEKRKISKKITKAKILDINLLNDDYKIQSYDVIVMFHVLEHIVEPLQFLKKLKTILTKKGILIIEVPNVDDFQLDTNEMYKEFFWQRAHIHYFNRKRLEMLLKKVKLDVKIFGVQRYSLENMINWNITNKPQLNLPSFSPNLKYEWLEKFYKNKLEKSFTCDTIIALAKIK